MAELAGKLKGKRARGQEGKRDGRPLQSAAVLVPNRGSWSTSLGGKRAGLMQEPKHGGNHCRCFLPCFPSAIQANCHPIPVSSQSLPRFLSVTASPAREQLHTQSLPRTPSLPYHQSQPLLVDSTRQQAKAPTQKEKAVSEALCCGVASRVWLGELSVMFRLLRFATPSSLITFPNFS